MTSFPVSRAASVAFVPRRAIKRAAILRPSDLRHVLRAIKADSQWPERDALVVCLYFGLRWFAVY